MSAHDRRIGQHGPGRRPASGGPRSSSEFSAGGTLPAAWVRSLDGVGGCHGTRRATGGSCVPADREADALAATGPIGARRAEWSWRWMRAKRPRARARSPLGTGCTRLSFSDSASGWRRLFDACVERAGDHAVALGRRYPVLRAAAARRVVYRTAAQNALIGLVFFVPGCRHAGHDPEPDQDGPLHRRPSTGRRSIRSGRSNWPGWWAWASASAALARRFVSATPGFGLDRSRRAPAIRPRSAVGLAAIGYFEKGAPASTSRVACARRILAAGVERDRVSSATLKISCPPSGSPPA